MHAEDIKAAIRKNGVTPAQIARDHGVSKMAVSHVLHGNSKSARIAQAISQAAKMPVTQLWPGKYPHLAFLEKDIPTGAAKAKAEFQPINQRRSSGRKAALA